MELAVSREDAKQRLQDRINKGMELKVKQINTRQAFDELSNAYSKWDSFNSELLKRVFTTDEAVKEYDFWSVMSIGIYESSLSEQITDVYKDVDKKIHRLDSIIERLELIPLAVSASAPEQLQTESISRGKKVFVVHGHDDAAKTNLEVFLHEVGLEPVVLHRQADQGLTVIEKFEKHSEVGYAFILLTPDEAAYLAADAQKPESERKIEWRARPNVIFEFGYFIGKLGRSRVCCLYTGNVSLPSDVNGMIYKRYEKSVEEVGYSIIKDLKAAGYEVA
jgi:predicted nucleotide-binding protein